MAILVDKNTRLLCQGITGQQASFHIQKSIEYGTNVVGGVTPKKGGTQHLGVPVFENVKEAKEATKANASIMYVPAKFVKSAVQEVVEAEIPLAVCIADWIPIKDMLEIKAMLKGSKTKLIGPNTPGIITPNQARLGIFPENIHKSGNIGIVSRSSTLTYEAVLQTNKANLGQSTVIGLGDDLLIGMDFVDILERFHKDEQTKAIVLIGQYGGDFEETAADFYKSLKNKKPIIAYVAGDAVPLGHKMGYAGDLVISKHNKNLDKKQSLVGSGMIMVEEINQIHLELLKL